jgi:hypothetical protein
MATSTRKRVLTGLAVAAAGVIGAAQPWNLRLASTETTQRQTEDNGSGAQGGPGQHGPVQQAGGDATGRDKTVQTGRGHKVASDNPTTRDNRGTTQVGTDNRVNSDNPTHSTRTTSDRHDKVDQHGADHPNAADNRRTTVNNPPARPDPLTGGAAVITDVAAADGGRTMSSTAKISVRVTKLPNNGNTLFLVCELLGGSGDPNLHYGKAELTELGPQSPVVQFGGALAHDPALIGTVRVCGVVSATRSAGNVLRELMLHDQRGQQNDPDGHPYDMQRTTLPDCTSPPLSKPVTIRVERV